MNESILSSFGLSKDTIPIYKLKKSEPISLEQFCPELPKKHEPEQPLISFFLRFIDLSFTMMCSEFKISPKSELKKPLSLKGIKLYEIKMFTNLVHNLIQNQKSTDQAQLYSLLFLYNGGMVGEFYSYIYSSVIRQINQSFGQKRLIIPKTEYNIPITPKWIVNYIDKVALDVFFDQTRENKIPTIADISCGLGLFFEPFLDNLFNLDKYSQITQKKIDNPDDLRNHLYGYESNELFIEILRLNNSFLNMVEKPNMNTTNLVAVNTLYLGTGRVFDIIIGCPPILTSLDQKKIMNLPEIKRSPKNQVEPYIIFLMRVLLTINTDGILYVVLPESILINPDYSTIRSFILERFSILELIYFSEKVVYNINSPMVIVGIQRKKPENSHTIKITIITNHELIQKLHNNELDLYNLISDPAFQNEFKRFNQKQSEFLSNAEFVWDIFSDEQDKTFYKKIQEIDCYKLKDLVTNNIGVEIGKNGYVLQCYNCKVWFSPPPWKIDNRTGDKFVQCSVCKKKLFKDKIKGKEEIIDEVSTDDKNKLKELYKDNPFDFILLDTNIENYYINGFSVVKLGYRGVKYKNAEIYRPKKIVVKKTSDGILATIDYNGYYTHHTLNQLSQKTDVVDHPYMLEYILGIITSSFISKFFTGKEDKPFHGNILSISIPKINFLDHNDETYGMFLHICLCVLGIQVLYQTVNKKIVEKSLESAFTTFLKSYTQNLARCEIPTRFKEVIGYIPQEFMSNVYLIEKPNELAEKLRLEIDLLVKKLFKID